MFRKTSVLISSFFMLLGLIPLGMNQSKDIRYEIHAKSVSRAIIVKDELIKFYKEKCYASSYKKIDQNIQKYISSFPYESRYEDQTIIIYAQEGMILMTGFLYETMVPEVEKKFFFG